MFFDSVLLKYYFLVHKKEKKEKKRHILRALWPKLDLNIFPSFSRATLNACSDKTQSQSQQYALSASAPAALLWSLRHTSNNKNYQHFLTDTLDALLRSDISIVLGRSSTFQLNASYSREVSSVILKQRTATCNSAAPIRGTKLWTTPSFMKTEFH